MKFTVTENIEYYLALGCIPLVLKVLRLQLIVKNIFLLVWQIVPQTYTFLYLYLCFQRKVHFINRILNVSKLWSTFYCVPEHINSGKHEPASARNLICFLPSFELTLIHKKVCFDMQYTVTKHVLCNCAFHYTLVSLCSWSVGIDKTIMYVRVHF